MFNVTSIPKQILTAEGDFIMPFFALDALVSKPRDQCDIYYLTRYETLIKVFNTQKGIVILLNYCTQEWLPRKLTRHKRIQSPRRLSQI